MTMIAKRRADIDDPRREALPDSPDSDPREVVDYVRAHTGRNIPVWVQQADFCDALTINNWIWWEDRRRELYLLRGAVRSGLSLARIGAQVGVGKQGVKDRIDRLDALLRYDRPDEKLVRGERRKQQIQGHHSPEVVWLERHRAELLAMLSEIVGQASDHKLSEAEREWIDELEVDARTSELSPATMVMLGLAVAELRTSSAVLSLPQGRSHPIHEVLTRAERVRSSFADLTEMA
jgi:hypothetical protein